MNERGSANTRLCCQSDRLLGGMMVAILLAGQCARGQDDDELDVRINAVRQLRGEELHQLQRQRVWRVHKVSVENWIAKTYGSVAGLGDHLETRLAVRLDDLQVTCNLQEPQRRKLQLAGRGDIKRLLDRLDSTLKEQTEASASDWQDVVAGARNLQAEIERPFAAGSLFAKTLVTTLSQEQTSQNERGLRDKNMVRYREAVTHTVHKLARLFDLTAGQRDELARLILTETAPPTKFGQSDYAFVMFQASRLPEAKLRAIFRQGQWATIQPQLASWADCERTLRKEGFEFNGKPSVAELEDDQPRSRPQKWRLRERSP